MGRCAWLVVVALAACGEGEVVAEGTPPEAPAPASGFAGSEACAACHAEQTAAWTGSHHARAWTAAAPSDPAFAGGAAELVLDDGSGPRPWAVTGWLGVDPLTQPLVPTARGRVQAADRAWDPAAGEWFDVFADARQPGDRGHWTGQAMTWNAQCAPCHTTGLEIGYRAEDDSYDTRSAEPTVGCEACHGPGAAHAAGAGPIPFIAPEIDVCAACHARRADLAPDPTPSRRFLDRYAPALPDAGDAFWADGRVRDEDFEYNAFLTSRMYQEGVRCGDCHEPHGAGLRREGDALCLECHTTHAGWALHDHHDGAVRCVDCHMPTTTYMQRDPRHDHAFRIPDPVLAAEIGAPDPCLACHTDRDGRWSAASVAAWGAKLDDRPQRARARAVAAARADSPDAPALALAMLGDPHPTWRAIAAGLLGRYATTGEVVGGLAAASRDPDPLVRFAVAGSLPPGHPDGARLAADPVRAVRVAAARTLVGARGPAGAGMADLATYLQAHRDWPDTVVEWGSWLDAHRDPRGLAELERAWALWPTEPGVAHALAVALSRRGDPRALDVLEQVVVRRPDDPGLWDALGRTRASAGDVAGGIAALERSLSIDPDQGRVLYNLGILLDAAGRPADAFDAWRRAMAAGPRDPDPPWAAASLHARQGQPELALPLVEQALAIDPTHRGALALKQQLARPPEPRP